MVFFQCPVSLFYICCLFLRGEPFMIIVVKFMCSLALDMIKALK